MHFDIQSGSGLLLSAVQVDGSLLCAWALTTESRKSGVGSCKEAGTLLVTLCKSWTVRIDLD